ncbi:MAG TPA: hypothetical protein VGH42_00875 [Verrucomicrobiae bacterium]
MIAVASVFILAALGAWLWHRNAGQTPSVAAMSAATNSSSSPITSAVPVAATSPSVATNDSLQKTYGALKTALDAASARRLLAELRAELAAMPTNEAVAAIKQFLDSKADASTQLGFKVARNGLLDDAPTLRTFLLDELARLDPAAAADYSKIILASMDSPDEWAVALRNLAWGDTSADGRTLLEQKTAEMLQYQPWQQNPSVGFLEAFDTAVYLGGTSLMPTLTDLVKQQDNPAVAHASYLALDRLVINNPTATLAALLADPGSMQGREATRANYFARADVSDPQQLQILENYLLNPQISPAEIDTFAGIFPNANYMISPNLLTQSQTPGGDSLASRDAKSLSVVQGWLADPRFANLTPALQKITARLQTFVQEANQRQ